jgi:hypothetical protein
MANPLRTKLGSCLNESFAKKSCVDVPLVVLRLLQVKQFGRIAESLDLP